MTSLVSRANPRIKFIRKLGQRKYRTESGMFIVEGIHHVGEALASNAQIEFLCYAPQLLTSSFAKKLISNSRERGIECLELSAELFNYVSSKENPQGILAVIQQQRLHLSQLNPQHFPCGVALVSPQDPGNIGTILRTIDAVGASGLLLLDDSADPYHLSAVRASMGAIFWFPIASASFHDFTEWTTHHAYHVYGTSSQAPNDYRTIQHYKKPLILLMGNERLGLTPDQSRYCHELIRLPMQGRSTSLNLAVATSVMLYDILIKSEAMRF
jgi:TrmH family RNA methyltransferase